MERHADEGPVAPTMEPGAFLVGGVAAPARGDACGARSRAKRLTRRETGEGTMGTTTQLRRGMRRTGVAAAVAVLAGASGGCTSILFPDVGEGRGGPSRYGLCNVNDRFATCYDLPTGEAGGEWSY
jgi:hypothetical protein